MDLGPHEICRRTNENGLAVAREAVLELVVSEG
jgi:hypothetical protein